MKRQLTYLLLAIFCCSSICLAQQRNQKPKPIKLDKDETAIFERLKKANWSVMMGGDLSGEDELRHCAKRLVQYGKQNGGLTAQQQKMIDATGDEQRPVIGMNVKELVPWREPTLKDETTTAKHYVWSCWPNEAFDVVTDTSGKITKTFKFTY